jgi:hypothetical protein
MTRMSDPGRGHLTLPWRSSLLIGALLFGLLALHGTSQQVSAQAAPQPAANCRGKVILPLGSIVSPGSILTYSAQGLEASAPYTIFIGGRVVSQASTTPGGTTGGTVAVPTTVGGGGVELQVTTSNGCASTTLTVGSTSLVFCSTGNPDFPVDCSSVATASGFFPISVGPIIIPPRTCVLPGTAILVNC